MKIFTRKDLPRLRYITGILLGDILGLSYEIVTDRRKLGKSPVINYSSEDITGALKINPCPVLSETGVSEQKIIIDEWKGLPVFFLTSKGSDIPFDIFAASFFLVSRYEEYLGYIPDKHSRFPASESLSARHGFLDIPVVDLWAKELTREILKKFPETTFKRNEFKTLLTIDSDQPFAYRAKNIFRNTGGFVRDILKDRKVSLDRYRVLSGLQKDPFQVYDYIIEKIEENSVDTRFFFPTGDLTRYDKNPSWRNKKYRDFIRTISGKYCNGIHPSYYSADDHKVLAKQIMRLETITGKKVEASRFHYLRFSIPFSYRNLLRAGVTEDYSMGYAEEPGFRAGIARPFPFYDVLSDTQTTLRIIPFQVMDATLHQYKKMGPEESAETVVRLINETRKVGGLFVSIWHNTSLINNMQWGKWRELFENVLKVSVQ